MYSRLFQTFQNYSQFIYLLIFYILYLTRIYTFIPDFSRLFPICLVFLRYCLFSELSLTSHILALFEIIPDFYRYSRLGQSISNLFAITCHFTVWPDEGAAEPLNASIGVNQFSFTAAATETKSIQVKATKAQQANESKMQ